MKKATIGAAIASALLAGAAYAQAPATPSSPATIPPASSAIGTPLTLAPADATKLREWITAQKTASVPVPTGFNAAVGATVPTTITLHPIPATVGITGLGTNQYAMI